MDPEIRYDDHLIVCFDSDSRANTYELGMQLENELVDYDPDAKATTEGGQTCLATSKAILLGGLVDLWTIVVAYDESEKVLKSGNSNFIELCK